MTLQENQDLAQLIRVLETLTSPDNKERNDAEKFLKDVPYLKIVTASAFILQNPEIHDNHKVVYATQIKNRCSDMFNEENQSTKNETKVQLLKLYELLGQLVMQNLEKQFSINELIIETITIVFDHEENPQEVADFFSKVFTQLGSPKNGVEAVMSLCMISMGIQLINKNPLYSANINPLVSSINSIINNLFQSSNLDQTQAFELHSRSFKYLTDFISQSKFPKKLGALFTNVVRIAYHIIQTSDAEQKQRNGYVFDCMMEMATTRARFFKGKIPEILDLVIAVFENYTDSSYENIKVSVINLFNKLFNNMPKNLLRHDEKIQRIVACIVECMTLMPEEEFAPEKPLTNGAVDEDLDGYNDHYQQHITRQAEITFDEMCVSAPDKMFVFLQQAVAKYLNPSNPPNYIIAGLNLLCCAGEGCAEQYKKDLKSIVNQVLPFIYNEQMHPKVRYYALTAIGQMCTDFQNALVKQTMPDLAIAYSKALVIDSSLATQKHAFVALNNLIECCPPHIAPELLQHVSKSYQQVLNQPKLHESLMIVILQNLDRISDLGSTVGVLYEIVRNTLVEYSKKFEEKQSPDWQIHCLFSLCSIGQHTSKEIFQQDVQYIMQTCSDLYTQAQNSPNQKKFELTNILSSFEILIRCFGDDFFGQIESILQFTMSLMQKCKDEMNSTNTDRERIIAVSQRDSFQGEIEDDVRKFFEETRSASSEIVTACNLIQTIAETYKSKAFLLLQKTLDPLQALIHSPLYMEDLMIETFATMTAVVRIAPSDVDRASIWDAYVSIAIELISEFTDPELNPKDIKTPESQYNGVMINLAEVIDVYGGELSAQDNFNSFLQFITQSIIGALKVDQYNFKKRSEKKQYNENEEIDEISYEESSLIDEEEYSMLEGIGPLSKSLFRTAGNQFSLYFKSFEPQITAYLSDECDKFHEKDVESALGFWADIYEYAPIELIISYAQTIEKMLTKFLNGDQINFYRVAAFSVGVIAERKIPAMDALISKCLPKLNQFISNNKPGRDDESDYALDNTYSSFIRIIRFTPQCVQNDLIPLSQFVISYLPFKTDLLELKNCYEFLCEIIEQDLMNIESKYGKPTLIEIITCMIEAFVIADKQIPQKLMERVKACSQKLAEANQQNFSEVLASMDQYRQNVFRVAIM